jgi:mono/diheme cytochrome c family protein
MIRIRLLFPALLLLAASIFTCPTLAQSKPPSDELAGAVLYRDKGCAHCHGAEREGTKKAPALAGIRNEKQWTPQKLTDQIMNGGKKMPPFSDSLSDPEIAQVVAYLRAKHPPVPPPAPATN